MSDKTIYDEIVQIFELKKALKETTTQLKFNLRDLSKLVKKKQDSLDKIDSDTLTHIKNMNEAYWNLYSNFDKTNFNYLL